MKIIIASIKQFFAQEKKKMEGKSAQEMWEYFLDYYKWWAIAIVLVIVSIVYTVVAISSQKDIVLSGYLLESYTLMDQPEVFSSFSDYAQINTEECEAEFITNMSLNSDLGEASMAIQQRLVATVAAGQTDFIAAPLEVFTGLCYQTSDYFGDLRGILTPEQLEALDGRIFYIDDVYRQELAEATLNGIDTAIDFPDPLDPDAMENPIPVGIHVSGHEEFDSVYLLENDPIYLGIVGNAPNLQMTLLFLEYLLG